MGASSDDGPLYLSILGQVYDVSSGRKNYGKDGGYSFFTGRDATRAYITGDFTNDLNSNLEGLKPEQFVEIVTWVKFYRGQYKACRVAY